MATMARYHPGREKQDGPVRQKARETRSRLTGQKRPKPQNRRARRQKDGMRATRPLNLQGMSRRHGNKARSHDAENRQTPTAKGKALRPHVVTQPRKPMNGDTLCRKRRCPVQRPTADQRQRPKRSMLKGGPWNAETGTRSRSNDARCGETRAAT